MNSGRPSSISSSTSDTVLSISSSAVSGLKSVSDNSSSVNVTENSIVTSNSQVSEKIIFVTSTVPSGSPSSTSI